jgi:hypothetical protein
VNHWLNIAAATALCQRIAAGRSHQAHGLAPSTWLSTSRADAEIRHPEALPSEADLEAIAAEIKAGGAQGCAAGRPARNSTDSAAQARSRASQGSGGGFNSSAALRPSSIGTRNGRAIVSGTASGSTERPGRAAGSGASTSA